MDATKTNPSPFRMEIQNYDMNGNATTMSMCDWFAVEDVCGDTLIRDRCVSFEQVREEFLFDLGADSLGTSGDDKARYGHESTVITRHHNFLVTIAGLYVQNAGIISSAEQAVLFVSKMLRLAYSYANRIGMFGDGVYARFSALTSVPWSRYMLVSCLYACLWLQLSSLSC